MLISIPTGTSTILGVFHAIFLISHFKTGLFVLIDDKANTELPARVIQF